MNAALLRTPRVAWPTVVLSLGTTSLWLLVLGLLAAGRLSWALALPMATLLAYVSFTPMHDATHRATPPTLPTRARPRVIRQHPPLAVT